MSLPRIAKVSNQHPTYPPGRDSLALQNYMNNDSMTTSMNINSIDLRSPQRPEPLDWRLETLTQYDRSLPPPRGEAETGKPPHPFDLFRLKQTFDLGGLVPQRESMRQLKKRFETANEKRKHAH
jgi:hypothetical protein